jgi:hypothetical protein
VTIDGYATLAEVKAELRLTTTVDDARLEQHIESASRQIEMITHRRFIPITETRVYVGGAATVWIDDARTVTLVEESADQSTWVTVSATSWITNARPPIRTLARSDGAKWSTFVRVTGDWGEAEIPAQVRAACLIQAVRLFKRADTPAGVLTGDFGAARLARIDPDVRALLGPLTRRVIG